MVLFRTKLGNKSLGGKVVCIKCAIGSRKIQIHKARDLPIRAIQTKFAHDLRKTCFVILIGGLGKAGQDDWVKPISLSGLF